MIKISVIIATVIINLATYYLLTLIFDYLLSAILLIIVWTIFFALMDNKQKKLNDKILEEMNKNLRLKKSLK